MKPTPRALSRDAFLKREQHVVDFYAMLPSDGWTIAKNEALPAAQFTAAMNGFANADMAQADAVLVDDLIIYLLTQPTTPAQNPLLESVARSASYTYANLLKGQKLNRPLRMRLQHLNLCIRNLLDKDGAMPAVRDEQLDCLGPWDFLNTKTRSILVTCDEKNTLITQNGKTHRLRVGMPTQIDVLDDERVSIGSLYSNGLWLWDGNQPQHIAHTLPFVSSWLQDEKLYAIDYRGSVYMLEDNACKGPPLATLAVGEISKCRRIDGTLYIFDWTSPHELITLDAASLKETRISLGRELYLANDIVHVGGFFYLIDKQQGYLFKYDSSFTLVSKSLGLGKGKGQLFDPISLRIENGELAILNWLSSKIVRVAV